MDSNKKFTNVHLALNMADLGGASECNPGGSYICTTGTKGCDAGLTCVGTSSTAGIRDFTIFEANLSIEPSQFERLSKELQRVVKEFSGS